MAATPTSRPATSATPTRADSARRSSSCRRSFATSAAFARFAGAVATVKCFEDNSLVKAALDEPGLGRVLVVDGGASLRRALVGGNVAAAAARNGWSGVVVDGAVRDVAELAVTAVGIRALALVPIDTEKRQQGERDVAVQLQGVWIRPGDRLLRRRRRDRRRSRRRLRSGRPARIDTFAPMRSIGSAAVRRRGRAARLRRSV